MGIVYLVLLCAVELFGAQLATNKTNKTNDKKTDVFHHEC